MGTLSAFSHLEKEVGGGPNPEKPNQKGRFISRIGIFGFFHSADPKHGFQGKIGSFVHYTSLYYVRNLLQLKLLNRVNNEWFLFYFK